MFLANSSVSHDYIERVGGTSWERHKGAPTRLLRRLRCPKASVCAPAFYPRLIPPLPADLSVHLFFPFLSACSLVQVCESLNASLDLFLWCRQCLPPSISLLLLLASLLESAQWSHCFHPSVLGPTGFRGRRAIIHSHASRRTKGMCSVCSGEFM